MINIAWTWTSESYEGRYLKLSISETVNWSSNSSTLNWTLTSDGGNVSYYAIGETTVTINGTQVYHNDAMGYSNQVFPVTTGKKSGSLTIAHDSNGTKSVLVSFKTRVFYTLAEEYAGNNIILTPIEKYTISYNANGGSSTPSSQTKIQNVALTLRGSISRKDSTSSGYTVSFNANGGNGPIASKTATNTTAYSFAGWNTNSSGTGTNYSSGGSYTANAGVTLYAKWTSNTTKGSITLPNAVSRDNSTALGYVVSFNANGGSCDITSKTAINTVKYSFAGWNTNSSGTGTNYSSGGSYTANAGVTLYAKWTSNTTKGSINLPTPVRNGYTFKGWAIEANAISGSTGTYTPNSNITLYAIWEARGLVHIDNGSKWEDYQIYIDNGSSWDLYTPYIDDGVNWVLHS